MDRGRTRRIPPTKFHEKNGIARDAPKVFGCVEEFTFNNILSGL